MVWSTGKNGRRSGWRGLFCAAAFLSIVQAAPARANDYFDLPPEELLNTRVTSVSKRAEPLSEAPAAAYVITREDIARAGVTTIPEALRLAPGVNVAQVSSNAWAVSIRGFNSPLDNKLLVMIDGRTVYDPAFAGTFWGIQDPLMDDIDRIEIIRGPGGALWGANAVDGVINIITRSSAETQGNYASALYGSVEHGELDARHGGAFADGGTYRVDAKAFDRGSFSGGDDGWRGGRGSFRADWTNFTLEGDVYNTNAGERDFIPNFTAPAFGSFLDNTLHYQGGDILGRWKHETDGGGLLSVQSYLDYAGRLWSEELDDREATFDIETQYNLPVRGRHEITLGGGYRLVATNESISTNTTVIPASETDNLVSFFLQDKIALKDDLFLTLGSKVEHNDFSGFEVEPNARLAWSPDATQTLWSAVSRAVRTPTLLERNATTVLQDFPGTQAALAPNPGFDSEDLIAYEAGYRKQVTSALSADLTVFYNDYTKLSNSHLLAPVLVNNGIDPPFLQFPIDLTNSMSGETHGFEIASDWKVRPDWTLTGSYSYLDMLLYSHDNTLPGQTAAEGQSPHHQAGLRSDWRATDNLSLNTSVYYVSRLATGDIKAYARVDMNLGYRISDNTSFNLIGQNLQQADHREFGNGAEVPRSVLGKLTWHF